MFSSTTKCATFSLIEEQILHIRLLENAEVDLDESKLMQKTSLQITGGRKFVAFIDARERISVSKESREWGSTKEAQQNMIAQAIWVNSLANRLIGNFIIQFHKPHAKTRLFSDQESALVWLREQLKNSNEH